MKEKFVWNSKPCHSLGKITKKKNKKEKESLFSSPATPVEMMMTKMCVYREHSFGLSFPKVIIIIVVSLGLSSSSSWPICLIQRDNSNYCPDGRENVDDDENNKNPSQVTQQIIRLAHSYFSAIKKKKSCPCR